MQTINDSWLSGNHYEQFMGRWSVLIAQEFLAWLSVPPARSWLDVGCGIGSLTQLILDRYQPKEVMALDSSSDFIAHSQQMITNPAACFQVGLAQSLGLASNSMDTAVTLNPDAAQFDEGIRFPLCQEGQLESLVRATGLQQVEAIPIEVTTNFPDFADYWQPFLGHVGPAPGYTMSLAQEDRQQLADELRQSLPTAVDGSISLTAKAWAVKCTV